MKHGCSLSKQRYRSKCSYGVDFKVNGDRFGCIDG